MGAAPRLAHHQLGRAHVHQRRAVPGMCPAVTIQEDPRESRIVVGFIACDRCALSFFSVNLCSKQVINFFRYYTAKALTTGYYKSNMYRKETMAPTNVRYGCILVRVFFEIYNEGFLKN